MQKELHLIDTQPECAPRTVADQTVISHRVLTTAEVHAIWTALSLSLPPSELRELHVVLKPEARGWARGWVICTGISIQGVNSGSLVS